jgi:hypothetical protein
MTRQRVLAIPQPERPIMYIPYKLLAVAEVAAVEASRYALNGVCVERDAVGKPIMIATNGHSLLSARWVETEPNPSLFAVAQETVEGFTTIIPEDHALRMMKFVNKKAANSEPDCGVVVLDEVASGEKIVLETADGALSGRMESTPLKLPFPAWRDVVPRYKPLPKNKDLHGVRIAVNPLLLADLLNAIDKAASSSRGVILTVPTEPNRPILLERIGEDGEQLLGVLMPMNDDTLSNDTVADWNWDAMPTEAEHESGGLGVPPNTIAEQVVDDIASGKSKFPLPTGEGTTTISVSGLGKKTKSVTLNKRGVVKAGA